MSALIALDESTSENIVTGGAVYMTNGNIPFVRLALSRAKSAYNIDCGAEIHCRELFAGDKRKKGPFKNLGPSDIIPFLHRVISEVNIAGCVWIGAHCDGAAYPKTLKMSFDANSERFLITYKHIAGMLLSVCVMSAENTFGKDFNAIYDKDSTKLDWGLARRMQATGFISAMDRTVETDVSNSFLLELADVSAYVLGRSIAANKEPDNRKLRRFIPVMQSMNMILSEFSWPKTAPMPPDLTG